MLHLLPIRLVLQVFAVLVAVAILAATYAGWVGQGDVIRDMAMLSRWSSGLAITAIALPYILWRWLPPIQLLIFPYLGGHWSGVLHFRGDQPGHRDIHLEIKHTLFAMRLLLDSDESTSSTLVVHAERNPDFQRYRVYYVYLNERKEGVPGAGYRYRGLAILRVEWGPQPKLLGNYFTEPGRSGTLDLNRYYRHPW
jgi:hypothetical protein